jgi:hypothetical protein
MNKGNTKKYLFISHLKVKTNLEHKIINTFYLIFISMTF